MNNKRIFNTYNAFDQSLLKSYSYLTDEEIEKKIEKCFVAHHNWSQRPLSFRLQKVKLLGEILQQNKDRFAQMISLEMGKVISEAKAEIEKCTFLCESYVQFSTEWMAPEKIRLEAPGILNSYLAPRSLGLVLSVMPWNYPFWQAIRFAIPSLIVGNGHLLRHASSTTACSLLIEEAFLNAGFPPDLFQSLICSHQQIEKMLSHSKISALSFTGSTEVGEKLAEISGRNLKKSILELGGSDPFVVFSDADIEKAALAGATSRLLNAGQSCISAKRFFIHKDVYALFIKEMKKHFEKIKIGNPLDLTSTFGPLSSLKDALEIESWINKAIEKNAKVITGGVRQGSYILPTIIEGVPVDCELSCREVFAPVAVCYEFSEDHKVVELANNCPWGLSASVWTKDIKKAEIFASLCQSGSVFVNSFSKSDPLVPFGGCKKSGWGREMGRMGLWEMSNPQTVIIYS